MAKQKQQPEPDYVYVSWCLIDGNNWCRDRKKLLQAAELGHSITMVNNKIIDFMNTCDLMHYLSGYPPIYRLTEEQWQQARDMGGAHG